MTYTELKNLVTLRLLTFGYTVTEADAPLLTYISEKAAEYVCGFCNFSVCPDDIPPELRYITADLAAGGFLRHKLTFAPGSLSGLNLDAAVKQITAGDTTTVFAVGDASMTDEQRLYAFIDSLTDGARRGLLNFRRVKWW